MADGDVPASLRAHKFAGKNQFEAFYDKVSERLLPVQLSTENVATFRARLRSANLGVVQLNELWASDPFVARRTSKHIASTDSEYLKVTVQLSGCSMVSQGGENITLRPGDFILYDTARPYQISGAASIHMQTLMFARDSLRLSSSQLQWLTTRRISGREGLGSLVAEYVAGLARQLDTVGSGSWHLANATLDLLAAAFADQLTHAGKPGLNNGEAALLLRIRTHIEHRLDDPDLDVASIAAAHHVSVRRLQNLFANHEQTVTGWIRGRRIEHCRRDLANAALADRTVSSIATRWGLFDPAHFSRLFKSTYGLSPREYRIRALAEVRSKAS
ncbi:MAG TPA: helix-turn-helix domain-containing protein [Mycobacterium sp.]|nr:helix-turn-helix domain-containing protein [Mycobacterium sp.]